MWWLSRFATAIFWRLFGDLGFEISLGETKSRTTASVYPIEHCSLDEKTTRKLAQLCELLGIEPHEFRVRFGREAVEQAIELSAGHQSREGYRALV
jgi:hypothetical protein